MHREYVLGADQVREVLLHVDNGPNLMQLIEPLNAESPVAKRINSIRMPNQLQDRMAALNINHNS